MSNKTKMFIGILALVVAIVLWRVYAININYRFTEVKKNKVYRSAAIPPEKLESYLTKYGIKTIVDLRIGDFQDKLNGGKTEQIIAEQEVADRMEGVEHINIPTLQVPADSTLTDFYKIMSDSTKYPVLIHCHDGIGRAVLFGALYNIEYENYSNEEARQNTRMIVPFSNFGKNSKKGKYLINYKKRLDSKDSLH
jgi:protein tyrosine/serine phosphatase